MGEVFSILCMGDSITAGSGGVSYSREFPLCITSPYEVENEGYPGAGSQYLRGRLELALDKRKYNIVCFMAGTNDLLQNPASDIIKWLQDSWDLALSRGSYVVALTLLEGRLNDDFHQNQKELNRLIKEAVAAKKDKRLSYYDANGAMPTQEARPDLWADQVHPSTPGYKVLGTGIGSYLDRLLGNIDPSRRKKRTLFRPCIDLHSGVVKQIVGGTLSEKSSEAGNLKTNWISEKPASYYAELYKKYNLLGGHVIMLGPNCTEAAESALKAWPGNLQIGGGINDANAKTWLAAGAEKVILTSWLFPNAVFSMERLVIISTLVGRDKLVVDLSCRLNQGRSGWTVAMNKWQTLTNLEITNKTLDLLQKYCSEFLIHAADVEGLQDGVDEHLVEYLGLWASSQTSRFQVTYAGGARSIEDLMKVEQLSKGYVDLTIGSALDIFGGNGATLDECVKWNTRD